MDNQQWQGKAILLVDLDAFFASVEQLDHPEWRGKPVIVGGSSAARGVVSTCSYEARKYGVRSAMASSVAERLCPDAIWVIPDHHRYKEVSDRVMSFLHDETPYVQQVSIDEAFLDVTPSRINTESPVSVAQRIQQRVAQLGVSCSIGVATTKTVAKIASEQGKPKGLTVVYPGTEEQFLRNLPVKEMSGIGAASADALHKFGVRTLGDLAQADDAILTRVFGKNAQIFRLRAKGQEQASVSVDRVVKSLSHELSFPVDVSERKELLDTLFGLSEKVGRRLRKKGQVGNTVTVKVRFANRQLRSAQEKMELPTNNELVFYPLAERLLDSLWNEGTPVRLIGVGLSGLQYLPEGEEVPYVADKPQMALFEEEHQENDALTEQKRRKLQSLVDMTDKVKNRFGEEALSFARTKK
ncbi:MAG: DNA polymerase IV [Eggerthellales bacterium]|nr:DNA polymerase IV [Eggerthellales bacterium]